MPELYDCNDNWYRCSFCFNGTGCIAPLKLGTARYHDSAYFQEITQELQQERDKVVKYYAEAMKAQPGNFDLVCDRMSEVRRISEIFDRQYRANYLRNQGYDVTCSTRYSFEEPEST